jgi:hypothetical protein
MSGGRVHRVVRDGGTTIAGRVHGQGPPLLLVRGGGGSGETSWSPLLPHLIGHFTCYAMSTRGRGLSDDHPDHTIAALIADVAAFAESIGEAVCALGHSSSLALRRGQRGEALCVADPVGDRPVEMPPGLRVAVVPAQPVPAGEAARHGRLSGSGRSSDPQHMPRRSWHMRTAFKALDRCGPRVSRPVAGSLAAQGGGPLRPVRQVPWVGKCVLSYSRGV